MEQFLKFKGEIKNVKAEKNNQSYTYDSPRNYDNPRYYS